MTKTDSSFIKKYFKISLLFTFLVLFVSIMTEPDVEEVYQVADTNKHHVQTNVASVSSSSDYLSKNDHSVDEKHKPKEENGYAESESDKKISTVEVVRVVDGDTIKVIFSGKEETVRMVGIDTPETVHPNKAVECFGKEASDKAFELLNGKTVTLVEDKTQGRYDKYGRRLAYVSLSDGSDFGEIMLKDGYAYEYTYDLPYEKQSVYKKNEETAKTNKRGLWAQGVCDNFYKTLNIESAKEITEEVGIDEVSGCTIKGNISISTGEKIYHVKGQQYYQKTVISEDKGERWFCSEEMAREAGWRKAMQ